VPVGSQPSTTPVNPAFAAIDAQVTFWPGLASQAEGSIPRAVRSSLVMTRTSLPPIG